MPVPNVACASAEHAVFQDYLDTSYHHNLVVGHATTPPPPHHHHTATIAITITVHRRLITVNTIKVPEGVDWAALVKNAMDKFNLEIAGGLGQC